jgi:phosphate-selective porin OprO/OprP
MRAALLLVVFVGVAHADPPAPNANDLPQFSIAGPSGFGVMSADGSSMLATHWLLQTDFRSFLDPTSPTHDRDTFAVRFDGLRLDAILERDYHAQLFTNFADNRVTVIDAWVEAKLTSWARVRIGMFEFPITQERLTRGIDLPFVSTSVAALLLPARDTGIQILGDVGDALSYNLAIVNGGVAGAPAGTDADTGKDVVGRVFVRPLHKLGLGIGASAGKHSGTMTSPELPGFASYGGLPVFAYRPTALADGWTLRVAPHATWGAGPVAMYADAVWTRDRIAGTTVTSRATSAIATVVVTGEDAQPLAFVTPAHPFAPRSGDFGAIELVAGFGEIAVGDAAFPTLADPATAVRGMWVLGGGINWFLSRGVAVLASYGHQVFRTAPGGTPRADEDTMVVRWQLVL